MELKLVDPRALKDNPDKARRSKSSPQADALLLATIKAVGIVEPPIVFADSDGANSLIIDEGHRRTKQAIAAGLEEIAVLVISRPEDGGAMRSLATAITHEHLHPVDLWRAIERLVALGWTEEAIGIALAQPLRQIKKVRLLATVLPAMLDHMARGDMPDERQLRTIAAASADEQKEVWKAHRPAKGDAQVDWWRVAQGLVKTRLYAQDASFDDALAQAHGIVWTEDLFVPADQDGRYTTDVDAFRSAQQEWMTLNLPKKGVIAELGSYGEVRLPPKAERIFGKPKSSDHMAMYLDRESRVKTVHFRMPEGKGKSRAAAVADETPVLAKQRPDLNRRGMEMIGDWRTDALHEAISLAPIEDETLLALLVLSLAGQNVRVDSGAGGDFRHGARLARHAAALFDKEGRFAPTIETLRVAARGVLIDILSCRDGISKSGIVAIVAGAHIGADSFLVNMGTEDFLSCLSRPALEAACLDTPVVPAARVKDTRAALVKHFMSHSLVHPAALFAPNAAMLSQWLAQHGDPKLGHGEVPQDETTGAGRQAVDTDPATALDTGYRDAAE